MSDEKQETRADILADIRERAENAMRNGERLVHNEAVANMLTFVADRIEAAWKRDEERAVEHATRHADAVARYNCRDCVHNPRGKNYEGGNAAIKALEAVVKVGYPHNFQREAPHIRGYCYDITEAIKKCFAALSAPPRNCDVYNDCFEAADAYEKATGVVIHDDPADYYPDYNRWLFAPVAERKGANNA